MRRIGLVAALICSAVSPASGQVPTLPSGGLAFGCGAPEKVEANALAQLAAAVSSPTEREAHLDAAKAAIGKAVELKRNAMAGKAVEAPYQETSRYAALAANSPSSELAELYRRVAEDQFARSHFAAVTQRTSWATGLSDHASAYAYYLVRSESCGVDDDNARWLRAQINKSGWFVVSKYGPDADKAAWLLVQHADRDVAFQTEALKILEPLAVARETDPKNYAYLYDRVAVNSGRPQRYGTQGRCTESGVWEPKATELPEQLDERRASVGLEAEATYIARFSCSRAAGA